MFLTCPHQTNKASFREIELVDIQRRRKNRGSAEKKRLECLVRYEKGVTRQVLRGQRNEGVFQRKCLRTR